MAKSSDSNLEKNKGNIQKTIEISENMRSLSETAKYIERITKPAREAISFMDGLKGFNDEFNSGFSDTLDSHGIIQGNRNGFWKDISSPSIDNRLKLNEEINELKKKLANTTKQLSDVTEDKKTSSMS